MTGMGGSNDNDPGLVHAFHQTLLYQGFVVAGLLIIVLVAANVLRSRQLHRRLSEQADDPGPAGRPTGHQPKDGPARRLLRVGFGLLWILDGILQGQASMPQHLVPEVILPATKGSPAWLASLVQNTAAVWTHHEATAAAATVWLQIGLGLWLLVAPRGRWSRLAGAASATWAVLVWIFGESLGAILAPGLSWLEGAPGAALLYAVAGALVALPDNSWSTPDLGRLVVRAAGVLLIGAAVLQAWPGRDAQGNLAGMAHEMARTDQPAWLQSLVGGVADHAGATNAVAIVALLVVGVALITVSPARPAVTRAAVCATAVVCLATWVTVQDLGFIGGAGTDPNSMIPWLLLISAGSLAVHRPVIEPPADGQDPAYQLRVIAAMAAVAVTAVGALPLTVDAVTTATAPMGASGPAAVRSESGCLPCLTFPGASTPR